MMITRIKISSKDNIVTRLSSEKGVKIDVVRCSPNETEGGTSILRIESGIETTGEEIVNWFTNQQGCRVISIDSTSPGKHLLTVKNPKCNLCRTFLDSDCFLDSASSTGKESVIWRLFTPNNMLLKGLIDRLRKEGCNVELLSVKKASSSFELTQIQDDAIRLAFSMGYYDIPKKVTLEEIALRSGISKATLNIILRRGQRKIS